MSEVRIRQAVLGDSAALARLIGQLGYTASEAEVVERLAEMQVEGRPVLIAELGGRIAGCLSTSIMRVLHRPKPVGRISMMVVDEALRGQGVGKALVRAAERALTAQGCGLIEVTSNVARNEAHRFYEQLDYERTSLRFAREPGATVTLLAARLREALSAAADPARAPGMQAYMKSAMPYLGVSAVPLRAVCKQVFAGLEFATSAAWQAEVLAIWRGARFREERYAAIELSGLRAARSFQRIDALAMYEELIATGAWWDYVDAIAGQRLLAILRAEREAMTRAMLEWAVGDDMWKRRSAILCQLNAKADTDLALLEAAIAPSLGSKEFFLRKAIGWALRQYARTDPAWVARYVAAHEAELSPLSKREALKHIA